MNFGSRRLWWWAVAALLLLGVFGWAWRHRESIPFVTMPLVAIATPFQSGAADGAQTLFAAAGILEGAVRGYQENIALRQENAQLRQQLTAEREVVAENIRLRELLGFRHGYPQYRLLATRVIGRDTDHWTNTALIDRGADDGVTKYMPVLVPGGLVGMISDVFPHSARVRLISDPRTAVSGIVQRPASRVAAIVSGNGNDASRPEMRDIVKEGDIMAGDMVVTSGYGGLYPKGIPIGTVESVEPDPSGVVKRALLRPAASLDRLEEVFVVLEAHSLPLAPENIPNLVQEAPKNTKGATHE